ncbi:HlyD family secretion protein [Hansschlegelia sp. KR7-227]|uniref:HlyD family secretion protein n=1 Tax=Hansschlegelia sp. KR7-227 TaxID=3400914 RepID=UPI003C037FA1
MGKAQMDPLRPRLVTGGEPEAKDLRSPDRDAPESRREIEREAPAEPAEPPAVAGAPAKPGKGRARKLLLGGAAALAIAAGAYYGHQWWVDGRFLIETDDAYVGADMAVMAPKISGYVAAVPVSDNARVRKGDPLIVLDDGDAQLAVTAAEDRIATQRASILRFDSQIAAAAAQVTQAQAQVDSAKADRDRAAADFERAQQLAKSTYGSKQNLDQAKADRDRTLAAVEAASAGVTAAQANREVLVAQKAEAERTLAELQTTRAQRQRDLDATVVRAPFDGVVGNKAVQQGDYVTPGKRVMAVVPLDRVYVDANFKETQLADITVGSQVRLSVDAYPEHDVTGVVDSLAPASGAEFSLLPPENATGNFTKIVQRVPVRIHVAPEDVAKGRLRPGLSVTASVDVRTAPKSGTGAADARR